MFNPVKYEDLNHRQKENYNFQKLASRLAGYGYNCLRLSDDWQGADLIACHIDGTFIKIQLKSRLTINTKYGGKKIHIAFRENDRWYIYPHDDLQDELLEMGLMSGTEWKEKGNYTRGVLSKRLTEHMEKYAILDPADFDLSA